MSDPKPIVGVVGASARAAVHSLARAGYAAWAVDLFADRDLLVPSARCPLDQYPRGMPALAEPFPPGPVLYTGGLENYPDVVAELAARRPLWGNPPAVLERVRDPLFMTKVWESAEGDSLRLPRVRIEGDAPNDPDDGRWLFKPRRGAGGDRITEHPTGMPDGLPEDGSLYLQEFIVGKPLSALFVTAVTTQLLGVTEQLVGEPWLHAPRFGWCGNVGPVELPSATGDALARFGASLAWAGGLVGLFGVDFILDAADVAWPVEVNPRYPASAEVIEHATGRALMLDHATAFGVRDSWGRAAATSADVVNPSPGPSPRWGGVSARQSLPTAVRREPGAGPSGGASPPFPPREGGPGGLGSSGLFGFRHHRVAGKAVYYAPWRFDFPPKGPWDDWQRPVDPWNLPAFADVPATGITIEPGWPVLTMLEGGSTPAEVRARLQSRAAELEELFDITRMWYP